MAQLQTKLAPLAEALRSGALDLTTYLDQLEASFAEKEAAVKAFLPEQNRFARLRADAATLAARFPEPSQRPALYGIPVGVKDIFHVDGFATQAGSRVPADIIAGPEAASVTQLKAAGALILGKTVTTEFAYFAPGPTRNPYNPNHTPGGSSSGSAAAVGAGHCPLSLGTQTIGSVVRPASFCGIVGYKPSFGRISTEGVIPLSPSVDHIGCFSQDVAGTQLVASALCENWDSTVVTDDKPVVGIPEGPYLERASAEGLTYFRDVESRMKSAGFEVKPIPAMSNFDQIYADHNALVAADAAAVHKNWFADFSGLYHSKTADLIGRGQNVSLEAVETYRSGRTMLRQNLSDLMLKHGVSLLMAPSAPGPAPATLESTGDPVMNLPWTYAGLPSVNVPAGLNEAGLPMGVQLIANWQQDEQLLIWATLFENIL